MAADDKRVWLLALAGAAIGSGLVGRFMLGTAADGILFWAVFAACALLLAVPLLLGELAVGQVRRRNVVDAFGPGPWSGLGWAFALACIPLIAFLSVLGGWAARLAYDSFWGDYFADAERHLRLITQGSDAMLWGLGVILVAWLLSWRSAKAGLRAPVVAVGILAALAVAIVLGIALLDGGSTGRDAAFHLNWGDLDAPFVVAAAQQALLPALLGFGVVATLSSQVTDRTLAGRIVPLGLYWLAIPLGVGAGLTALAAARGIPFGDGLVGLAVLAAGIGGTAGGMLAGTLFGLILAGCLVALVALLEVPATVLAERANWSEPRGSAVVALLAYLLVVPMAFVHDLAFDVERVLAAILAPLAGLALAVHVGWFRPTVLDGMLLGPEGPALHRVVRPMLRYVLPLPLLLLAVVGTLDVAVHVFGATAGSTGLWKLVP